MSSMAKIFVVVNLAFGIFAFGSAATLLGAQDDYKMELGKLSQQFEEYRAETDKDIADLENQRSQQSQKASEELARANQLEAERDDLNARLADANTANQTLMSTVDTLTQELRTQNQVNSSNKEFLDRLSSDVQRATEEMLNAKTQLDKEIGNRVGLEQQVTELSEQVQTLAAEKGELEGQNRELRFWLSEMEKRYGKLSPSEGAPGVVSAVRDNLVSISVGTNDGVRVGDVYHIRRGGTYIGQIRITTVDKNLSVGIFDTEFTGPTGAPPQKGDTAYPGE